MAMSKVTLLALMNGILLLALTLADFFHFLHFNLVFSYQWHKILHLVGVVLMMGNMVVGPIWFSYAYYSGDKKLLVFAGRLLQITDMWLTLPGIFLTVINGLCLAAAFGGTRNGPDWLFWSVIALIAMWALSMPVLFLQEKMYQALAEEPSDDLKIRKLIVQWGIWGTLVMLPPTLIFYWMVMKRV